MLFCHLIASCLHIVEQGSSILPLRQRSHSCWQQNLTPGSLERGLSQKKDTRVGAEGSKVVNTFGSSANTMSVKRYFSIAELFLNFTRFIHGENHKAGVRILTNPQLEFVPADHKITASCYKLREENWCAKEQFEQF